MYLAVVPLLSRSLEGVCIPLSWTQSSGVKRSFFVGRCGVGSAVPVDPSDLRPPLDGDVGRIEAKVLDHDLPGWMFLCHGRRMFVCPGDGHSEQRAHHNQSRHRHQQDDALHKPNLLLLLLLRPHSGAFVYKGSTQLDAWSDDSPECVEGEFCEVELPIYGVLRSSVVAKACKCRSPSEPSEGSGLGWSKAGVSSVLRGCLEVAQQPALVLATLPVSLPLSFSGFLLGLLGLGLLGGFLACGSLPLLRLTLGLLVLVAGYGTCGFLHPTFGLLFHDSTPS